MVNEVLNKDLPKHLQINYVHLDWKKFKKETDFVKTLHKMVSPTIEKMGIFTCFRKRLPDEKNQINIQRGIIRLNCIDSLDRTNEAMCFVGLYVFQK